MHRIQDWVKRGLSIGLMMALLTTAVWAQGRPGGRRSVQTGRAAGETPMSVPGQGMQPMGGPGGAPVNAMPQQQPGGLPGQQPGQQPPAQMPGQQPQQPQLQPPQLQTGGAPAGANGGSAAAAVTSPGGGPGEAPGLEQRLEDLTVSGIELSQLLSLLQAQSGVQMVLGQNVNAKVTFSLTSPTLGEVLDTVLPANGLDYYVREGGIVYIDTIDKIAALKQVEVEIIERVFRPQYVDVTQLQAAIESTLSPNGSVIIDPDSQQIIVRDVPASVEAIADLITSLDVTTDIRVFDIQFGNAEEIADQLTGVINTEEGELFVDYRNNRIIIRDIPERLDQAAAIIEQLDQELEFVVIPLAFALPEDVMPIIEGLLTENGYIDYDPRTSRLFLQDIPSVIKQVQKLIKQLDIATQQVYIEADIVQVNNDKNLTLGTSLGIGKDIGLGGNPAAPVVSGVSGAGGSNFFSFNPFLTTSGSGLTLLDVSRGNYRIQVDALVERKAAEVIASPRLMIQDGGYGSFTLGSQEPFAVRQQGYYGGFGGGGGDYFTQAFRDVGTSLNLEVYASEAGYVEMYIGVEDTRGRRVQLQNVGEGLAVDGSFVETSVTVKSGRTVVLGGIINRRTEDNKSGVPVLSSIPVLGTFFRNKTSSSAKQKMLIFITPNIVSVDDPYEFSQIDNRDHIKELQSKGATKFAETDVDKKFLDWTNEEDEQQEAINEALEKQGRTQSNRGAQSQNGASASGANRASSQSQPSKSQKKPSNKEQMESGIIRRYSNR